jgi:hypothetical protein
MFLGWTGVGLFRLLVSVGQPPWSARVPLDPPVANAPGRFGNLLHHDAGVFPEMLGVAELVQQTR